MLPDNKTVNYFLAPDTVRIIKSRGEVIIKRRMIRAWLVQSVQMEWNPRSLAERLLNMEHTCTVWYAQKEPILMATVKNSALHALYAPWGAR